MTDIQKLYEATDGGLAILSLHFPEVAEAARSGAAFRMRQGERTASAHVKRMGDVWKVTDFGGDGRMMDPLDVHKAQTGQDTAAALRDLCARFGLPAEGNAPRPANAPRIERQQATAEQKEGEVRWDIDQDFSDYELRVMGQGVTAEVMQSLNWYRVNWIASCKNRIVTRKYSTERYPIFMRECTYTDKATKEERQFYKIYEPLNADKGFRFQYRPAGAKPPQYINGLYELRQRHREWNDDERSVAEQADREYREQKYPEAVICSGERDALCVRAMGYWPLWFNSETYNVSDWEWSQITQLVETVYNIPDIDSTGLRRGRELALKFMEIKTIWLPEGLKKFRDHRGNPCKDFRDFREHYKKNSDFERLRNCAVSARFWRTFIEKNNKPKTEIVPVQLLNFLELNGFRTIAPTATSDVRLVRVQGSVVDEVKPYDIRNFVDQWARDSGQADTVRNALLKTPFLSDSIIGRLQPVDLDFKSYTPTSQRFYFRNTGYEVTPTGITPFDYAANPDNIHVWRQNIVDCAPRLVPDMFTISCRGDENASESYDIDIHSTRSKVFGYLINSSRIYWRKELEDNFNDPAEAAVYHSAHRFDIAGEGLSAEEIQEQKQCLISKIFCIGYILHRYKAESKAWAPFAMDNVVDSENKCNGRSGKSFFFNALKKYINTIQISGRATKEINRFTFQNVKKETDMVFFDDCWKFFPFQDLYDTITGDMSAEGKNQTAVQIAYKDAPKFVFNTNYIPADFDASTINRMLFLVFSDYYHQATEDNGYCESRSIRDDFGMQLMNEYYPAEDWEADSNFMMQCVRFYLSVSHLSLKIQPVLRNIQHRKALNDMTENFGEWAEGYFCEEGEKLDTFLVRQNVFEDYIQFSGLKNLTMKRFTRSLNAFVGLCEWTHELNPKEFQNANGRIIQRQADRYIPNTSRIFEMIYIRSAKEHERMMNDPTAATAANPTAADTPADDDPELPF